jgi:4-amino-4-deoxy-L-arabinose transferase-like glycosyltransferase
MRLAAGVVALLCLAVLFLGLDLVGMVDSREARDACVVAELTAQREFLSPLYGSEPLFEKPVLAYAPDRVARLLTPGSPLASRVWRATLAMALVLGAVLLGAQYFGWRAGWFAGGVLVTSAALPLAARTDGTQLMGTLLGWVGVGGLADAVFGRRSGLGFRLIVTYGALAAALRRCGRSRGSRSISCSDATARAPAAHGRWWGCSSWRGSPCRGTGR